MSGAGFHAAMAIRELGILSKAERVLEPEVKAA